jgi:hypothetical protein
MRIYLELFELVGQEQGEEEPDFIRIDITEWEKSDVETAVQLLREHAGQSYEHYILQIHYCRHEEGESCSNTIIDER